MISDEKIKEAKKIMNELRIKVGLEQSDDCLNLIEMKKVWDLLPNNEEYKEKSI